MDIAIRIIVGIVALLHLYFMWFEMFAWETTGRRIFKSFPRELFTPTKALAANQGLYNGFLSAGLIWTFFIENGTWADNITLFFLTCVSVAGVYGAFTADKKIFFVQSLPALIGILIILLK